LARDGEAGTMEAINTSVIMISPVGGIIKEVNGGLDENSRMVKGILRAAFSWRS